MSTYSHGGYHRFDILDRVVWSGAEGRVIALTICPSVTVEFDNGDRLTVGQDVLELAPTSERTPHDCSR